MLNLLSAASLCFVTNWHEIVQKSKTYGNCLFETFLDRRRPFYNRRPPSSAPELITIIVIHAEILRAFATGQHQQ